MTDGDLLLEEVETIVEDDRWRSVYAEPALLTLHCVRAVCEKEPRVVRAGLAVLLADDSTLRGLNRQFRGLDKPTNVLAFPAADDHLNFLGDVAIAYETCVAEAAMRGVAPAEHAAHLIVHGVLHLVGYDHQSDLEAEHMEGLESRVLQAMGYADPHADHDVAFAGVKGDALS